MLDLRLQNASVIQIVGPSGSGKTYFTTKLLSSKNIFLHPIRDIFWHSGIDEGEAGATLSQLNQIKRLHIIKGLPKGWIDRPKRHDAIVIDDLFEEVNKEHTIINQLFTKIARHREVTVLFLTQNLFHQGGKHRTRNLNTHYLVIFKNPRDQTVVDYIARQAYPNNRKFLIESFHDATNNKPHGYLFLDFTQQCPEEFRVQADIFNTRTTVYTINNEREQ
jgi:adenylate kinase family enzyme